MKNRERWLWAITVVMLLLVVASLYDLHNSYVEAAQAERDAKLKEAGEVIFECAEKLEAQSEMCSEVALEYAKRGNLIFKCEEEICEINGWTKPMDFDEWADEVEEVQ